jgi:hypothetical protein
MASRPTYYRPAQATNTSAAKTAIRDKLSARVTKGEPELFLVCDGVSLPNTCSAMRIFPFCSRIVIRMALIKAKVGLLPHRRDRPKAREPYPAWITGDCAAADGATSRGRSNN